MDLGKDVHRLASYYLLLTTTYYLGKGVHRLSHRMEIFPTLL